MSSEKNAEREKASKVSILLSGSFKEASTLIPSTILLPQIHHLRACLLKVTAASAETAETAKKLSRYVPLAFFYYDHLLEPPDSACYFTTFLLVSVVSATTQLDLF